jgi:hypothetical protein
MGYSVWSLYAHQMLVSILERQQILEHYRHPLMTRWVGDYEGRSAALIPFKLGRGVMAFPNNICLT